MTTGVESVLSDNNETSLSSKSFVFTLHNGKLLVTPKDSEECAEVCGTSKRPTSESEGFGEQKDEIYIEIFCKNDGQTDLAVIGEDPICNISSAYGAFWNYNFEQCIERRTCTKCNQVLLTPQHLIHHWSSAHKVADPEECFVCHKLFMDEDERKTHCSQIHHLNELDFVCEVCLEVFKSTSDKNVHISVHFKDRVCKWCQESFPCEFLLNNHLKLCPLYRKDQDCHICGCHFRSSHILQLHRLRHTRIICDICHVSLLSEDNLDVEESEIVLIRHMKILHDEDEVRNVLRILEKQDEEEESLDKLFMSQVQSNLIQLNNIPSAITPVVSAEPLQTSSVESKQKENDGRIDTYEIDLQCSECSESFESREQLLKHHVEHQRPFYCNVCKMKFSHRRGYKKHMRSHGIVVKPDSARYKCNQCTVFCNTLSGLRSHFLTHTDEKPHLCERCGMSFRRAHALKKHEKNVHTSRVSNTCPECGSFSFSKTSLDRHMQCVHGGVRRFICGLCCTRYLQNQDLRRHLKCVHKLEFPPMKSISKKSTKEVHVVPPVGHLEPTDPLVHLLKLAVKDEEMKLEALKQKTNKPKLIECTSNNHYGVTSDMCTDGISLDILGDVASKAEPLEQASEILQSPVNQKLHEPTNFLCAGCQYVSVNLDDFSFHLTQCHPGKSIASLGHQNLNALSSTDMPLSTSSVPISNQLCFSSSQNAALPLHLASGSVHESSLLCSVLPAQNTNSAVHKMSALTFPMTLNPLHCSSSMNGSAGFLDTSAQDVLNNESASRTDESSKLSTNIMVTESFSPAQLEMLSTPAFHPQEEIEVETDAKACNLNNQCIEVLSQTDYKSIDLSCENFDGMSNFQKDSLLNETFPQTVHGMQKISFPSVLKSKDTLEKVILQGHEGVIVVKASKHDETLEGVPSSCLVASVDSVMPLSKTTSPMMENEKILRHPTLKPNVQLHKVKTTITPDTNHLSVNTDSDAVEPYPLPFDKSEPQLDESKDAASKDGQNICAVCGKKLSCASNYKRHLQVHFGLCLSI